MILLLDGVLRPQMGLGTVREGELSRVRIFRLVIGSMGPPMDLPMGLPMDPLMDLHMDLPMDLLAHREQSS